MASFDVNGSIQKQIIKGILILKVNDSAKSQNQKKIQFRNNRKGSIEKKIPNGGIPMQSEVKLYKIESKANVFISSQCTVVQTKFNGDKNIF